MKLLHVLLLTLSLAVWPFGQYASSLNATALPPLTLIDQWNQSVSLPNGKVWVVTFIFTTCRGACPALMQNITAVQDDLPKAMRTKVEFAAITFDPETDQPSVLKTYGTAHHFNDQNEQKEMKK